MASYDTRQKLARHPEWIAPRSDRRVFLGEPGGPEATKTTVEPGNIFSPGMRTFGVTWWLRFPDTGDFFATETAPLESLRWSYEAGHLPLLHCTVNVRGLNVRHSLFQDGAADDRSEAVCGQLHMTNTTQTTLSVQVYIALRSLGPAGGPVADLMIAPDGRGFWLCERRLPLLGFDCAPTRVGCGVGDPSPLARQGRVPHAQSMHDAHGWCYGLACFDLTLQAGQSWQVHFDCPQQSYGVLTHELPGTAVPRPELFDLRCQAHLAEWRGRFADIDIQVPDSDFRNAFFAGLQHMLTATVRDQVRIAPLSYPLPWLRDSVFIIRSLDLAGFHDLARAATEHCAQRDFFGGFGAEGDAPGQGIWAIVEHYRITHDKLWLAKVYPDVRRKCSWLFDMRRTTKPIQILVDTPVLPRVHGERNSGVICLPAQDGIIMGVMDHGVEQAVGWVNHWALCGLREAAYAARELGLTMDAALYDTEADELAAALESYSARHPDIFGQERTMSSLLWPTRAWEEAPDLIKGMFDTWWLQHRGNEMYRPEPYWLYFELAQAHNALLFGEPERAWQVLEYRLQCQDLPGLYGWREGGQGVGTENAVLGATLIGQIRGCQRFDSIMPHGWAQAEMWLLQRAMLVEEWKRGLLLFAGIPRHWLGPNARLAFHGLATWYGRASAELSIDEHGRCAHISASGLRGDVPIYVSLNERGAEARSARDGTVTLSLAL